jgi:hypothetical protein
VGITGVGVARTGGIGASVAGSDGTPSCVASAVVVVDRGDGWSVVPDAGAFDAGVT